MLGFDNKISSTLTVNEVQKSAFKKNMLFKSIPIIIAIYKKLSGRFTPNKFKHFLYLNFYMALVEKFDGCIQKPCILSYCTVGRGSHGVDIVGKGSHRVDIVGRGPHGVEVQTLKIK